MSQIPTSALEQIERLRPGRNPAPTGGPPPDALAQIERLRPTAQGVTKRDNDGIRMGGVSDLARGWDRSIMGLGSAGVGLVGAGMALNPATAPLSGVFQQTVARPFAEATRMRQAGTYGPDSGTIAEMVGGAAPQFIGATGAGMLTGGLGVPAAVAAFAGTSAAPVVGQTFQDATVAGQSPQMAALEAAGAGAITGATSYLPGVAILSKTPVGGQLLRQIQTRLAGRLALAGVAEVAQESIEGAAQDVLAIGMRDGRLPTEEEWGGIIERAADPRQAIVSGLLGSGGRGAAEMGGIGSTPPQRPANAPVMPPNRPTGPSVTWGGVADSLAAQNASDVRMADSMRAVEEAELARMAEAQAQPPLREDTTAEIVRPQARPNRAPADVTADRTEVFTGENAQIRAESRAALLNQSRADGEPTYSVQPMLGGAAYTVVPQVSQSVPRRGTARDRATAFNRVLNPSQRGYTTEGSLRPTDVIPSPGDMAAAGDFTLEPQAYNQNPPSADVAAPVTTSPPAQAPAVESMTYQQLRAEASRLGVLEGPKSAKALRERIGSVEATQAAASPSVPRTVSAEPSVAAPDAAGPDAALANVSPSPQSTREPWEMTRGEYGLAINPRGVVVEPSARPVIHADDLDGMYDEKSRVVHRFTDRRGRSGSVKVDRLTGHYFADVDGAVAGFASDRGSEVELAVASEFQGDGIGQELAYAFRRDNPFAKSGGLTEGGSRIIDRVHKKMVRDALASGKPVPPEVLADYPDLAQSAPKPQGSRTNPSERAYAPVVSEVGQAIGIALQAAGRTYSKAEDAANAAVSGILRAAGRAVTNPIVEGYAKTIGKTIAGDKLATAARKVREQVVPQSLMDRELLATIMEAQGKDRFTRQQGLSYAKTLAQGGTSRLLGIEVSKRYANETHGRLMWEAITGVRSVTTLPLPLRPAVENVRKTVTELGERAVKAGILSRETFDRNKDTYLARLYDKRERERLGLEGTGRRAAIQGDRFKQRLSDAWAILDRNGNAVEWGNKGQWRFDSGTDRDAFLDALILSDAEKILRAGPAGKVLRITPAQIADPSTIAIPDVQNAVETAIGIARGRYSKNDPKTLAELEARGLITQAGFPVGKTIVQLGHDVAMAELFNKIAARVDWASDTQSGELSEQIPDQKRYGALRGKYVSKPTFDQLTAMVDFPSGLLRFWDDAMRLWKKGKTIYNPATHGRNMLGNLMFSDLAGISPSNPENAQYFPAAVKAIAGKENPKLLRDLYETGILGSDLASAELTKALVGAGRFDPNAPSMWFDRVANGLRGVDNAATSLYQLEDAVFKVAAYIKQRANGASKAEAAAHVRRWFPFYDQIPDTATTRTLRRTVMPFGSFMYEAVRIGANAAKFQPITLAKWAAAPALISLYAASMLGLDDEDRKVVFDGMRGYTVGGVPVFSALLPFRDTDGRLQQFDMTNLNPFASLLGARVERDADEPWWQKVATQLIAGNPAGSLAVSAVTNRDPYFDRRIVQKGMGGGEAAAEVGKFLGKTLLPPLTPGVGTAWDAVTDTKLPKGTLQKRNPTQQRLRSLAGVDLRTAEPSIYKMIQRYKEQNELPVSVSADDTTPQSRARSDAYQAIIDEDTPAFRDALARLDKLGKPIRTGKDVMALIDSRDPLRSLRKSDRPAFIRSLSKTERDAVGRVLDEYAGVRRRALPFTRSALTK